MGVTRAAKDAAKRNLSPEAQQTLKAVVRRITGPRRPSRLKPVPTDPLGAARHAVLVAHSSRRPLDHARARVAMGEWTVTAHDWRVAGATPTGAPIRLGLIGPDATTRPEGDLVLGLPGSDASLCDEVLLPHGIEVFRQLGMNERAATIAALVRRPLAGRSVASTDIAPADDLVLLTIARSLTSAGDR